jgi:hypothetical protein
MLPPRFLASCADDGGDEFRMPDAGGPRTGWTAGCGAAYDPRLSRRNAILRRAVHGVNGLGDCTPIGKGDLHIGRPRKEIEMSDPQEEQQDRPTVEGTDPDLGIAQEPEPEDDEDDDDDDIAVEDLP